MSTPPPNFTNLKRPGNPSFAEAVKKPVLGILLVILLILILLVFVLSDSFWILAIIPAVVGAMLFARYADALIAFAVLLFGIVAAIAFRNEMFGVEQELGHWILTIIPLTLLSMAARFQTLYSLFPKGILIRKLGEPALGNDFLKDTKRSRNTFRWVELVTFVAVPIAVIAAAILMTFLAMGSGEVGPEYGVLPQTFSLMKVVLAFGVLLLLTQAALAFARSTTAGKLLSSIDLRGIIWSWNRREQALVGRQVAKRKRAYKLRKIKEETR